MLLLASTGEKLGIGPAAGYALLGYAVVFFGIVLLMAVMLIMGKVFTVKAAKEKAAAPAAPAPAGEMTLDAAIEGGLKAEAGSIAARLLEAVPPMEIVGELLIPALDRVGAAFEAGRIFLPQLIQSAGIICSVLIEAGVFAVDGQRLRVPIAGKA